MVRAARADLDRAIAERDAAREEVERLRARHREFFDGRPNPELTAWLDGDAAPEPTEVTCAKLRALLAKLTAERDEAVEALGPFVLLMADNPAPPANREAARIVAKYKP